MLKWLATTAAAAFAYGVWAMGAPEPSYIPTDCSDVRAYEQSYIDARRQLALSNVNDLYSRRADIYGFAARFRATFHNTVQAASEFINWSAGKPVWQPSYPRSAANRAGAGIIEFALIYDIAVAFGVAKCTAALMVPERNVDNLTSASTKLELLLARLDHGR